MRRIDLNCDMGESFGAWRMGADAEVMPLVSSANIACGFHAGDGATIRQTIELALAHGVAVGAHPGLPDLQGFGRRAMKISPQEMYDLVLYQAGALQAFARVAGVPLHHVKCHGALYNTAAGDEALSDAMARAVRDLGADVILYALAGSTMADVARRYGLRVAAEGFADRAYRDDGTLAPRGTDGAMIEDEARAVAQALSMVREGRVTSVTGNAVAVVPDTLCLHGDQPGAVAFARALRAAFAASGVEIGAP